MQAVSQDVKTKFEEFQAVCKNVMPKANLHLVIDLLRRVQKQPGNDPLYTIEVFTIESLPTIRK